MININQILETFDETKVFRDLLPFYLENRVVNDDPSANKGSYEIIDDNAINYSPNFNSW